MQVVTDFPPTIPLHDVEGTTATDYVRKLDELDRLLNDPDVPIQPELIWCLLDEAANAVRLTKETRRELHRKANRQGSVGDEPPQLRPRAFCHAGAGGHSPPRRVTANPYRHALLARLLGLVHCARRLQATP
jgi:hypothetical protein